MKKKVANPTPKPAPAASAAAEAAGREEMMRKLKQKIDQLAAEKEIAAEKAATVGLYKLNAVYP